MVPSRLFRKSCETKTFTAEASDLTGYWSGGSITLISDFGHAAMFDCVNVRYDDEGDIQCWVFQPVAESVEKIPALKEWSVTIFND